MLCVCVCVCMCVWACMCSCLLCVLRVLCVYACELKLQRQGKEINLTTLFSIFIEKSAALVGFEPTTSCFQDSRSTN